MDENLTPINETPEQAPAPAPSKGLAIASLVLGIVAACIAWWGIWCSIIALACGIVGIILGAKAKKQAKEAGTKSTMANVGFILALIGTILAGIGFIACGLYTLCAKKAVDSYNGELQDALNDLQELQ